MDRDPNSHYHAVEVARSESAYRVVRVSLIAMCCVCLFFAARAWQWDVYPRVVSLGIGSLACLLGYGLLQYGRSHQLVTHVAMLGVYIAAGCSLYSSGGLMGSGVGWLCLMPMIAGLMAGRNAGLLWFVCSGLTWGWMAWYESSYGAPLDLTPVDFQFWQNRLQLLGQLLLMAVIMVSFLHQVAASDDLTNRHIDELGREIKVRSAAQAEAFNANKAKSEFLASMSHELRTPLNSIIGFSHHLIRAAEKNHRERSPRAERESQALEAIHSNGHILLSLINELLDLSKLESGAMKLNWGRVHMGELVSSVVRDLQGMAIDEGVVLNAKPADDIQVIGDALRVRQVLTNLISNGLKYTEQGSVTIEVFDSDDDVVLSVSDTGVGMDPEKIETLFDVYSNLSSRVSKPVQSTGLGLSLCHKLVELHGGHIEVITELGNGSEFRVHFPKRSMASVRPAEAVESIQ